VVLLGVTVTVSSEELRLLASILATVLIVSVLSADVVSAQA
jgi:hypothetical protein